MKPQKPLHSPTPQRKVSLMINHAIQDSVPEAWLMNHGDVEKTYLVKGGKKIATIQGPAAHQIRPLSSGQSQGHGLHPQK